MNKQPILILAVCFLAGILFQDKFSFENNTIYVIIGFCILISGSILLRSYELHKVRPYLTGLLFFGIGIVLHFFNTLPVKNFALAKNETIVFKISKKLNSTGKNKKYEAISQMRRKIFHIILYIPKNHHELDFNHYYKSNVFIIKSKPPGNDFQFDYARYLRRRNIEYQCYSNSDIPAVQRYDLSLSEKFSQKRLGVLQNIDKSKLPSESREFLKGIILADRTEIDSQTLQDFNRSGLIHFLAISGTHIVVIFGLVYFLLVRILPLRCRKYAIFSSLIFIWLFAAFIGFGNSVVRSCIMLSVYYCYVLLQRKPDLLHSLALAAFIILLLDTQQIFDVGFQLSFLAVLGIFWLNEPILKYFPKQDNWLKKVIFNTISISLSAQIATLPLVLYYFHQFSLISVMANFFIVPFSEAIIIFSLLMTVLAGFKLDFSFISFAYDFVIQILLKIIHWFAGFDSLFFENIWMSIVETCSLFLIVYWMRFAILKCNLKNLYRLMISVLVFVALRTGFNIYEQQKDEFLVHDFSRHKILSVKNGRQVCFWVNNSADKQKIRQYIINPYCSSRRIKSVKVKALPESVSRVVYHGKIYEIN